MLLVVAAYPAFKNDSGLEATVSANPGAAAAFGNTGSITSTAGWLNANMYANVAPLLALLLPGGCWVWPPGGPSARVSADRDIGVRTAMPDQAS